MAKKIDPLSLIPPDPPRAAIPVEPKRPGFMSDVGSAISSGWDQLKSGVSVTADVLRGNPDAAAESLARQLQNPPKLVAGEEDLRRRAAEVDAAQGFMGKAAGVAGMVGSAITNPRDTAIGIARQLPNSIPSIALGAAGAVSPVPGGTALGIGAGTAITEFTQYTQQAVSEALNKLGAEPTAENIGVLLRTPAFVSMIQGEAARKGVTQGVLDAALTAVGGSIAARPWTGARTKALVDQGVDVANAAAVKAALADPAKRAAIQAAEKANRAAIPLSRKAGAVAAGAGIDTLGEGVGEYAGMTAATGEGSVGEAALESIYGAGSSVLETGMSGAKSALSRLAPEAAAPVQPTPPVPEPVRSASAFAQSSEANKVALAAAIGQMPSVEADAAIENIRVTNPELADQIVSMQTDPAAVAAMQAQAKENPGLITELQTSLAPTDPAAPAATAIPVEPAARPPVTTQAAPGVDDAALLNQLQDVPIANPEVLTQEAPQAAQEAVQAAPAPEVAPTPQPAVQEAPAAPAAPTSVGPTIAPEARLDMALKAMEADLSTRSGAPVVIDRANVKLAKPNKTMSALAAGIERAFGTTVLFTDIQGDMKDASGNVITGAPKGLSVNGARTILINKTATNPINTIGHELAHQLKFEHEDLWQPMADVALKFATMSSKLQFSSAFEKVIGQEMANASPEAKAAYIKEVGNEELVSEIVGDVMGQAEFWDQVFTEQKDPGAVGRIMAAVHKMLDKARAAFVSTGFVSGTKPLQEIRKAIDTAFQGWSQRVAQERAAQAQPVAVEQQSQPASPEPAVRKTPGVPLTGAPKAQAKAEPVKPALATGKPLPKAEEVTGQDIARQRGPALLGSPDRAQAPAARAEPAVQRGANLGPAEEVSGAEIRFERASSGALAFVVGLSERMANDPAAVADLADAYLEQHTTTDRVTTINADDARPMSPFYEFDPTSYAAPVHEQSSAIANAAWEKALQKADKKRDRVLFMAGGGGSGKGYIQGVFKLAEKDTVIFDGTLSKLKSAQKKIDQALATGMPVEIVYVNTPAIQALRNAVKRAKGSGRVVPLGILAEAHAGASSVIRQLVKLYDGRATIRVFNSTTGAQPVEGTIEDVFRYDPAQLEQDLYEEFDRIAAADPGLSEDLRVAFTGVDPAAGSAPDPDQYRDGGLPVRGEPDRGPQPGAQPVQAQPDAAAVRGGVEGAGDQVRDAAGGVRADAAGAAQEGTGGVPPQVRFRRGLKEAGGYQYEEAADGGITVFGDQEEIRSVLPGGVQGRLVQNGVYFTPTQSPRVLAALEGESVTYGRAGKVAPHPRYQGGARAGQYIGAPEKYNTPAKLPHLRRLFRQLAIEGEPGKLWYERSGAAILRMTGSPEEARKFISLLAIYSPQAKVDANSTFALRAWAQYRAGEPIQVKTGVQDRQATEVLYEGKQWGGEKTNNFYRNLMREVDAEVGRGDRQGVTVDMWMMRAAGYDTDAPTQAAYRFVENETNRLAQELGWEPQQVQAAIWVAMKARTENPTVKAETEKESLQRGFMQYVDKVNPETGKKSRVRDVINEVEHRKIWLRRAMELQVSEQDTNGAKFDFADGVRRHLGQISWEARPGRSTGLLPGVHDAPYQQQAEFQQAIAQALTGPNGEDLLAKFLGLLTDGRILAPGVWQSDVAAGMQTMVGMAPAKGDAGKSNVDPAQAELLNIYADALGLLLRQEAVGWHKPFYATAKRDQNGLEVNIGRPLRPEETRSLWSEIDSRMRALGLNDWETVDEGAAIISTGNGVRAVQFGILPNDKFRDLVKDALSATTFADVESVEVTGFKSDGKLLTNTWRENPNGESYRQRISASRRPDVLGFARSVLAPAIQATFEDFSERYGWGNPGQLRFSRAGLAEPAGRSGAVPAGRDADAGQGGRGWSKRPARPGSSSVDAWHFSGKPDLRFLTGSSYGSGIKGAEADRLARSFDRRIKRRVYFYIPKNDGSLPAREQGLGPHRYEIRLGNLYEPGVSPRINASDANGLESAILDAGYDGYLNRSLGMAVVLDADVPARYVGPVSQAAPTPVQAAPERARRALMSKEIPVVEDRLQALQEADGSLAMRSGTVTFDPSRRDALNAVLADTGVRLSRQSIERIMAGENLGPQLMMDNPSAEMLAAGMPDLPLVIPEAVVRKVILGEHTYGISDPFTPAQLAAVPQLMSRNVAAVFRSGDRDFLVMLSTVFNGGPIMISLTADQEQRMIVKNLSTGKTHKVPIQTNKIDTIYPKNRPEGISIEAMLGKGDLRYWNRDLVMKVKAGWVPQFVNGVRAAGRNRAGVATPQDLGDRSTSNGSRATYPGKEGAEDRSGATVQRNTPGGETAGRVRATRYSRAMTQTAEFRRWFGDSKIVDEQGRPRVAYHGTAQEISSFRAKQAGAIFVTFDPVFAELFSQSSEEWMAKNYEQFLNDGQIKAAMKEASDAVRAEYGNGKVAREMIAEIKSGKPTGEAEDVFMRAVMRRLPSGQNVMPLYVKAERPFDYENPDHIRMLDELDRIGDTSLFTFSKGKLASIREGQWLEIESKDVQERIRHLGFDGFYVKEGARKNLAVYDPSQLKSATGNRGTFDPTNPDIRYSRNPIRGTRFTLPADTRRAAVQRAIQDRFNRVMTVQEAIESQGGLLDEANDTYRAEERASGRAASRLEWFKRNQSRPLLEKIGRSGVDLDELALYLYASHAKERNARIASINDQFPDGGSGMTNEEADNLLAQFRQDPRFGTFQALAADLQRIQKSTRQLMVAEGLIDQETANAWEGQYGAYVPLRGFESLDEGGNATGAIGRGWQASGPESRRALGRESRAGQIVENILRDHERTIIRAEKNRVAKAFLKFVRDNKDDTLWEVNRYVLKPYWQKFGIANPAGEVRYRGETLRDPNRTIVAKVAGQEYHIVVKDEILLKSLQGGESLLNNSSEAARKILLSLGWMNRTLAKMWTALNPAFTVINFARDAATGFIHATSEYGLRVSLPMMKDLLPAAYGILKADRSGNLNEWGRWYQQYQEDGGKTGFFQFGQLEDKVRELEVLFEDARNLQAGGKKAALVRAKRALASLEEVIMDANGAIENAIRVAAYRRGIEVAGMSRAQAASFSKNLTVNFNRRGDWSPLIGSAYLFFNPAVQGSARIFQAARANPRAFGVMLSGLVGLGMMLGFMAAGDQDEEGVPYWDKSVPEYEKQKNIVIMTGGGNRVTIPTPYGYGFFVYLGYILSDAIRTGGQNMGGRALQALQSMLVHYSPVGGGDSPLSAITPTVLDPWVEVMTNKRSTGAPLAPDDERMDGTPVPDSSRYWGATRGSIFEQVTTWLNEATGGTKAYPGLIDVSPESVKNVFRYYTGGAGSFLYDVLNTASMTVQIGADAAVESNTIPFVKQLYKVDGVRSDMSFFMEKKREALQALAEQKAYYDTDRPDVMERIERNSGIASLGSAVKSYGSALRALRLQEIEVHENQSLSTAEKYEAKKTIEARKQELLRDWNGAFYKADAAR